MDLLKDWLAPTIQRELTEVLQRRESDINQVQPAGNVGNLSYEDDGSNLRVKSEQKGVVQIIKFLTFDDPTQAVLSDSHTRINASIAAVAVGRYERDERQSFSKGKIGGLIQILDFEIVATHLGPRSSNLTLYIKDFKSLGSDGSGGFGIPTAIERKDGDFGFRLVQRLKLLRAHVAVSSQRPSAQRISSSTPSICSQASSESSGDEGPRHSQATFATQVPRAGMTARKTGPKYSSREAGPPAVQKFDIISGSLKPSSTTAPVSCPTSRMHNVLSSGQLQTLAESRARPQTKKEDPLLELLAQAQNEQAKRATFQMASTFGSSTANTRSLVSNNKEPVDLGFSILRPVRQSSSLLSVPVDNGAGTKSSEIVAKVSTECTSDKNVAVEQIMPNIIPRKRKIRDLIKSKDVAIPKDQEALLSSLDAWLPAEPGRRKPTANVPISILQTFNRDADLRAQRTKSQKNTFLADPSSQQRNDSLEPSSGLNHNDNQESESDVPLSSTQWPPSPACNQLPPDSSVPGTDQSDHTSRQRSVRATSDQSKRSSYASVSSRSIISNSSGEEIQRFRCQAEGCCKSYRSSDSLKCHIERHHGPLKSRVRAGTSIMSNRSRNVTPTSPILETNDLWDKTAGESVINSVSRSVYGNLPKDLEVISHAPGLLDTNEWIQGTADSLATTLHSPRTNPEVTGTKAQGPPLSHSSSSTPDSGLEMTTPFPLQEITDSHNNSVMSERYPSTASQPEKPFTQVKRTPFTSGHTRSMKLQQAEHQDIPTKQDVDLPNNSQIENTENDNCNASNMTNQKWNLEDQQNPANALKSGNGNITGETVYRNANTQHQRSHHSILTKDHNGADHPERGSETDTVRKPLHENIDKAFRRAAEKIPGTKRKILDSSFLYCTSSKRRKAVKFPAALHFSQDPDDLPDPSISLRQHRQDWFASRRSSGSSAARESPTSPPPNRVGALSYLEQNSQSMGRAFSESNDREDDGGPDCLDKSTRISMTANPEYNGQPDLAEFDENFALSTSQCLNPRSLASILRENQEQDTQTCTPMSEERGNGDFNKPADLDAPAVDKDLANEVDVGIEIANYPPIHVGADVSLPCAKDEASLISLVESEEALVDRSHVPSSDVLCRPVAFHVDPCLLSKEEKTSATAMAQSDHTIHTANVHSSDAQKHPFVDPRVTALEKGAVAAQLPLDFSMQDGNGPEDLDSTSIHATTQARTDGMEVETFHTPSRDPAYAAIGKSASPELLPSTSKDSHEKGSATAEPEKRPNKPRDIAHAKDITPHPAAQLQWTPPAPVNIFSRFKATYPDYTGDLKHFVALGKRIYKLLEDDQMEHRSLWDDFVIRHKINYAQYVFECTEEANDPFLYEKYYSVMIDGPKYTNRVIKPQNLHEILHLEGSLRPVSAKQSFEAFAGRSDVPEPMINPQAERVGSAAGTISKARLTIDLTEDDEESKDLLHKITGNSSTSATKTVHGATPWRKAGIAHSCKKRANESRAKKSSSMLTLPSSDQPRPSHNRAAAEIQEQNGPKLWWQDQNTPFKTFVRAYALIRPGNGNSYAIEKDAERRARLHEDR